MVTTEACQSGLGKAGIGWEVLPSGACENSRSWLVILEKLRAGPKPENRLVPPHIPTFSSCRPRGPRGCADSE